MPQVRGQKKASFIACAAILQKDWSYMAAHLARPDAPFGPLLVPFLRLAFSSFSYGLGSRRSIRPKTYHIAFFLATRQLVCFEATQASGFDRFAHGRRSTPSEVLLLCKASGNGNIGGSTRGNGDSSPGIVERRRRAVINSIEAERLVDSMPEFQCAWLRPFTLEHRFR